MESNKHHNLVKSILNYSGKINCVETKLIQSDIFEISGNVTKMKEGYIPDVYYNFNKIIIIGEAKTSKDIDCQHSMLQLNSYINFLRENYYNNNELYLIIATGWQDSIHIFNIIKKLMNSKDKFKVVILNELGEYKVYEKNYIK